MTRRQFSPSRNYILIIFALAVAAVIGTGATASPNPNPGAPQNSTAPNVSGNALQGQTLSVDTGSWSGNIQSYSYAWQRCSSACAPIDGATDASYTLTSADVGASISAVVYASGKKGSTSATSNAVGPVAPLPAAPPPPPPPPPAPSPTPSPTVTITSPSAGSTVAGSVTMQAAVANGTPTSVSLTVDGGSQWSGSTSPYAYSLDTTKLANGTHTLAAKAVFSNGSSVSASESVNVQNSTSSPTPTTTSSSRIGLWRPGSTLSGFSNLDKYGLVIVSAEGAAVARTLSARTLIYSNASGLHSSYTEGLSYATASANGCLLGRVGTGDYYVFDHTKASCNQLEADADVNYVKQQGLKGLFLDDVVPMNPYGFTTPSGWESGMVSFVHLLHQELSAAGLYLLTNANGFADPTLGSGDNGTGDLNWAKQLAPDGVMNESWEETRDGTYRLRTSGTSWDQNWDGWQAYEKGVLAAGMDFVGLSYNTNASYGYASMLLNDNGHAYFIHANTDGSDPWGTWAKNEGSAVDPAGTNPRRFQNGTASVNSSSASAAL